MIRFRLQIPNFNKITDTPDTSLHEYKFTNVNAKCNINALKVNASETNAAFTRIECIKLQGCIIGQT